MVNSMPRRDNNKPAKRIFQKLTTKMPSPNSSPNKALPGRFITLEGPDGAGKTTQLRVAAQELKEKNYKHIITRDPGGTTAGKHIRRILLNAQFALSSTAELLLYQADRAQNVAEIIRPALEQGTLVFCDRYIDSTIAYQGYGRGLCLQTITMLNEISTGGLKPDLTILFDLDSEIGLSRLHPGSYDRLEREALDFHQRVREGYLTLAKQEPERFCIIDAGAPFATVQSALRKAISKILEISL
jgi:dTMP kinase